MVGHIMVCALAGTVGLIGICSLFPTVPTPKLPTEPITPPAIIEEEPRDHYNFSAATREIEIKEDMKNGVVERSVEIMLRLGIDEEEIKSKMKKCFSVSDEFIDEIINSLSE